MKTRTEFTFPVIVLLLISSGGSASYAQEAMPEMPKPTRAHALLKKEVGDWKAEMKAWMGPGDPIVSYGREHNEMLGGFWCLSKFEGTFAGEPFLGSATLGYDQTKKIYTGSWIDSMTPERMSMTGTYDDETRTMTWRTETLGMDGKPVVGKMVVVYEDDDHRSMTMFNPAASGDEMMKVMEVNYTRLNTMTTTNGETGISLSPAGDSGK
jgi:hypothetical protein